LQYKYKHNKVKVDYKLLNYLF